MIARKIIAIASRDYVTNIRRKAFLAMLFGFPFLMLIIFGVQAYFGSQMKSGSFTSNAGFIDYSSLNFESNSSKLVKYSTAEELKTALLNKKIDAGFIITRDYLKDGNIQLIVRKGELTKPGEETALNNFLLARLLESVNPDVGKRIQDPANVQTFEIDRNGQESPGNIFKVIVGLGIGIALIFSLFMTSSFLLQSIVEEKENRMIEVLLSSISAKELMAGKVLGLGALSLTQMAVWFGLALLFAGIVQSQMASQIGALQLDKLISPAVLLIYLLLFIGGFLLFSSIYVGIGSISTSMREGQQLSSILILPAVTPLWFMNAILVEPNGIISRVLSMFPLSSPLGMIIRMNLTDVPAMEIIASILLLYISVLFFVWASAKIFRAGMLMYGKRPNLKEILLFLKEA